MSTRALPYGFDMTPALQSPLETQSFGGPGFQAPDTSPLSYASTFKNSGNEPRSMTENSGRMSRAGSNIQMMQPTPHYDALYSPLNNTASQIVSPVSSISERAVPNSHSFPPGRNGAATDFLDNINTVPAGRQSLSHISSLQFHDISQEARIESLASPLRASTSYINSSLDQRIRSPSFVDTVSRTAPLEYARAYHSDAIVMNQTTNYTCRYMLIHADTVLLTGRRRPRWSFQIS